ncbi:MAG: TAXI family TRAP transporter solute-binding subunit [Deltaproteobacteria bacterium]|nr:TAXI family TRAP transporter solute-binding subunit [Deltaproteobacteria bacterium]
MGLKKTGYALIIFLFCFVIGFQIASPSPVSAELRLTLATSPMGGSWYPMAAGLADLFNKNIEGLTVTVEGTGGGATNPKWLAAKKVEIALTTLDMFFKARDGERPYNKKYDLSAARSIILQHSSPSHWIVLKKSNIRSLKDLKGKRIAIGERGAAGNTRALWYLEVAGLSKDDVQLEYIGDDQAAGALKDGRIDAWVEFVGVPAPAVLNLATTTPIRFLNLTANETSQLKKKWPYMVPTVVKAGTYKGQEEDFTGFGVTGCFMALETVPADIVYQMCKVIDSNWEHLYTVKKGFRLWRFAPDIETVSGQPLHPGALKFYEEKGLK